MAERMVFQQCPWFVVKAHEGLGGVFGPETRQITVRDIDRFSNTRKGRLQEKHLPACMLWTSKNVSIG